MNRLVGLLLIPTLAAACASGPGKPIPLPEPLALGQPVALPDDPARQFDFWLGSWEVTNLEAARDGSWQDFGNATARVHAVADGTAVLEQWSGDLTDGPLNGFSLRAWDPRHEHWSVWLNWHGGQPRGFSEMHGRRNGERLELLPPGDDRDRRYSFTEPYTDSCRWDRARSPDGETWISDWVMQFARRDGPLSLDASNAPIVRPPGKISEDYPVARQLDYLIGAWEGPATFHGREGDRQEGRTRMRVTSMIEGFGLLQFLDTDGGERNVMALAWDATAHGWLGLAARSSEPGIARLKGDLERRKVLWTDEAGMRRESFDCPTPERCSWRRDASTDDGATWTLLAEADLTREASTAAWIEIRNARAPFEGILTGGQPTAEQFEWAVRNGYRTIVNLRTPGEDGELPGQDALLADLGVDHVVLPMAGAAGLTEGNAARLAEVLAQPDALPAMVHCASGNRVGALFGLKAHSVDGLAAEEALAIARRSGVTRLEPALRERLGLSGN